jgi:hypothetical protein
MRDNGIVGLFLWVSPNLARQVDEEKTSFIMPFSTYCYLRVPEGLKSASPMLCRMMRAILKNHLQRNIFTYVDDIVVSSKRKEMRIDDLGETFANMHNTQLKLNPEKCIFGVQKGKVLGGLVSVKGIEANPDKINAIVHMKPPQSRKDVERLTGRIA